MAGNAGRGYVDGNDTPTGHDYTIVDYAVACDADGWVNTIKVNIYTNGGGNLDIGCGTLSGSTFTPRAYVTLDVSADGTGQKTYTAPTDFTAFRMLQGDYIFFYSNDDSSGSELDKTNTGGTGLVYVSGYHMDDANFETSDYPNVDVEMEFEGVWGSGDMNTIQAPAKINNVDAANVKSANTI